MNDDVLGVIDHAILEGAAHSRLDLLGEATDLRAALALRPVLRLTRAELHREDLVGTLYIAAPRESGRIG